MASGIHLAIDAVGMRRFSGGPVVLLDLLDALAERDDVLGIIVFASPKHRRDFSLPATRKIRAVECNNADRSRLGLLHWVTQGLDRACVAERVDGLVSLNALGQTSIPALVLFQQQLMFAPEAVRLMPLKFRARLTLLRHLARRACQNARLVVAQAPHVAACLEQGFDLDPSRVCVVPPDIRWPKASVAGGSLKLAPSTLAYVGSDDPYKSLETLLFAFRSLKTTLPDLELSVTLEPENHSSRFAGVRCLGTLPREDVRTLLVHAKALIMPSLAETVGLPLLEAMDVGCPVVAADLPYARDVCGPAAAYFAPRDPESLSSACRMVLERSDFRRRLIASGLEKTRELRAAEPYARLARLIAQSFGAGD